MTGTRRAPSSNRRSIAHSAAFMLSVSMWVSAIRMSTPPSRRAAACSRYEAASSSKVIARAPGSLTSGESDAVLVVGPIEPTTQRGRWAGSAATKASTASRATRAAARLIVLTSPARP